MIKGTGTVLPRGLLVSMVGVMFALPRSQRESGKRITLIQNHVHCRLMPAIGERLNDDLQREDFALIFQTDDLRN